MKRTAKYWIEKLQLQKHPEGGWFREVYQSDEVIPADALPTGFSGSRSISTSIYYLLEGEDFSAFHRIKSDEIWHFYTGTSAIEIISVEEGKIKKQFLGDNPRENQFFQIVVPKNTWFAARLVNKQGFALAGCTVSPGFHFDDFEMANQKLIGQFPELENEIVGLIRK
jgi:predicted cupin superfamily sugar epimerase